MSSRNLFTRGRSPAAHRGGSGHPGGTKGDRNTLGLYLRSLGRASSVEEPPAGSFPLGLKSSASGSTSSSKRVSRGEGLGFAATLGHFFGFLELENHR